MECACYNPRKLLRVVSWPICTTRDWNRSQAPLRRIKLNGCGTRDPVYSSSPGTDSVTIAYYSYGSRSQWPYEFSREAESVVTVSSERQDGTEPYIAHGGWSDGNSSRRQGFDRGHPELLPFRTAGLRFTGQEPVLCVAVSRSKCPVGTWNDIKRDYRRSTHSEHPG